MIADHGEAITRHVARLGTPNAELDDIAQQAFMIAGGKLVDVDLGSERAFLFGVASRLAGNARRAAKRRRNATDRLSQWVEIGASPEEMEDRRRTRARVADALRDLPVELRTVFVACDLEELSVSEIAAELGIPEGTAASRLRRARKAMREFLATPTRSMPRRSVSPEVLSWWVSRGEVEALEALFSIYRRSHPRGAVIHAAVAGSSTARREIETRMACGAPPDTFQANGGSDLFAWVDGGARLAQLDTLVDTRGWSSIFHPDVLDLVTHRGHVYGVPIDIHRLNTLFYDRRTFARLGLTPPRTLPDFYRIADELKNAGTQPLALGLQQPWVATLLAFENLLVAIAGPDYFRQFFLGKRSAHDSEIREALAHFSRVIELANDDASRLTWDQAVDRLGAGAAMTIMGDWAKGHLRTHVSPDDYGSMASPGTEGVFVFATDAFALPASAPLRDSTIELLSVFVSNDGQDAFSGLKGSIPARVEPAHALTHRDAHGAIEDFGSCAHVQSLTSMVPSPFTRALDGAMAGFVRDRDPDAVVSVLGAHYPLLGRSPR